MTKLNIVLALAAGADVGMKMAQALRHGDKLPNTLYYDDRQWHNVLNVLDVEFKQETYIDIDARMGMFKIGYSISSTQPFFDQTWRPGDFEKIN